MRFNDALIGAALVAFAALIAWYVHGFPPMPGQQFGPSLFPRAIAAGFALTGLALIASGLRRWKTQGAIELSEWMRTPRLALNFAVVIGAMAFYILFSDRLGFLIAAPLALLAILLALRNRWFVALPTALVAAFVIHWIFYGALKVPLPWGLLEPLAW
ncbi:MAG TPA: tripartite tricarboxylate transporter TctB family protein [Burkholderiales bacterium]|jgi:putative tricarboxylic transport membrane protein|nr:tripartite tricarboxylate transporter TctB family protein [Burkholderiales bacterium]